MSIRTTTAAATAAATTPMATFDNVSPLCLPLGRNAIAPPPFSRSKIVSLNVHHLPRGPPRLNPFTRKTPTAFAQLYAHHCPRIPLSLLRVVKLDRVSLCVPRHPRFPNTLTAGVRITRGVVAPRNTLGMEHGRTHLAAHEVGALAPT